ncbi:uncharacterized protein LOC134833322 [Culicoides brevitarsis]|uniref:uncharacterized protein LOC134833322 n=1 Tax=Culicoides brevitarsis TaxID=469753 RepID=UPI00307C2471
MPKEKQNTDIFDTRKFISLVEAHQILWNTRIPRYFTDTTKKREAWLEIADEMYPNENFDIKIESEKDEIANMLWSRWKSIRDGYTRESKRVKNDPNYVPPYPFYQNLLFLGERPTRAKRQPRSKSQESEKKTVKVAFLKKEPFKRGSITIDEAQGHIEYEEIDPESEQEPPKRIKILKNEPFGRRLVEEVPEEIEYQELVQVEDTLDSEIYLETEEHLEPTHEREQEMQELTTTNDETRENLLAAIAETLNKSNAVQEMDEHELFLKSILPDLRKIPQAKKFEVRMAILSAINKALQD